MRDELPPRKSDKAPGARQLAGSGVPARQSAVLSTAQTICRTGLGRSWKWNGDAA